MAQRETSGPASPAIAFLHLTYTPPGAATPALKDLSLEIEKDEIFVLLGESGSGKTTLLRMVNGLLEPSHGRVTVNGSGIGSLDPIVLRRQIGYVLQDDGLFPHRTVFDNVALVPRLLGWEPQRVRDRVGSILELVNLPPNNFALRYPHQLSGGQRQRVGLARALAGDQEILLLDEPFGRLDPLTRERLRVEFRTLCKRLEKTALFVTHDLREALLLGDRVGLLLAGSLAFVGTPAQFMASKLPDVRAWCQTLELGDLARAA